MAREPYFVGWILVEVRPQGFVRIERVYESRDWMLIWPVPFLAV